MTVKEIRKELKKLPQEVEVGCLWDGAVRSSVDGVYLSQSGLVVFAEGGEPAYYDKDRPKGAPTEEEYPYYKPIK